ncbi:MAG: PIN domain-containing protein [Thermoguttaceae bacterium]
MISEVSLDYGAEKSARPQQNHVALDAFLAPLMVAEFDSLAAARYGEVRAALERIGTPIGPLDTMIAAHALSLGVTLVTNNVSEFSRVVGLKIENWMGT